VNDQIVAQIEPFMHFQMICSPYRSASFSTTYDLAIEEVTCGSTDIHVTTGLCWVFGLSAPINVLS
jgi:hypothetical protein